MTEGKFVMVLVDLNPQNEPYDVLGEMVASGRLSLDQCIETTKKLSL